MVFTGSNIFETQKFSKLLCGHFVHRVPYRSANKVKCTLVQALRLCTGRTAHRGSRGIALLFHDQRHYKGGKGSASRPGRSLTSVETREPIVQEAGWAPGPSGTGAKNLALPQGFDPRTVQPVASRYTD